MGRRSELEPRPEHHRQLAVRLRSDDGRAPRDSRRATLRARRSQLRWAGSGHDRNRRPSHQQPESRFAKLRTRAAFEWAGVVFAAAARWDQTRGRIGGRAAVGRFTQRSSRARGRQRGLLVRGATVRAGADPGSSCGSAAPPRIDVVVRDPCDATAAACAPSQRFGDARGRSRGAALASAGPVSGAGRRPPRVATRQGREHELGSAATR